jgi:hypothetical protein
MITKCVELSVQFIYFVESGDLSFFFSWGLENTDLSTHCWPFVNG